MILLPTFYWDILDCEPEDNSPDHTQRHLNIAVHDFWKRRKKWLETGMQRNNIFLKLENSVRLLMNEYLYYNNNNNKYSSILWNNSQQFWSKKMMPKILSSEGDMTLRQAFRQWQYSFQIKAVLSLAWGLKACNSITTLNASVWHNFQKDKVYAYKVYFFVNCSKSFSFYFRGLFN